MPVDFLAKIHVMLGGAIHAEIVRAQNDAWFGLYLAAIQDAFEDPAQKEQLRAAGYNSFKDIVRALPYDESHLYKKAKIARSLQQRALFACYEVGITWRDQELLTRLPDAQADAARAVLQNAEGLPPEEVKKHLTMLLNGYSDAVLAKNRAKAEGEKDKELRLRLHEDARKMKAERDEARELARRNEAAAGDIPVTHLGQKVARLLNATLDVIHCLDNFRFDDFDREHLRRYGGRACQSHTTLMRAFDRAVGEEGWLPDGVVKGPPPREDAEEEDGLQTDG